MREWPAGLCPSRPSCSTVGPRRAPGDGSERGQISGFPRVRDLRQRYHLEHAPALAPVCLLFSYLRLIVRPDNSVARVLSTPANTPNSHTATWQNGQFSGLTQNCDANGNCTVSFGCATAPVPVRGSTWGQVKALYR